ncbi:DUF885 domain-containing protein [Ferrimonas pelagia]|uniref:DUF885 domain-containing protein n=1 Tax=Ferrimonas pelagia TaxID=1177826 RepID=A0ABP9F3G0_9GAMM
MKWNCGVVAGLFAAILAGCSPSAQTDIEFKSFAQLSERYFDDLLELNPVQGTFVGRAEFNGRFENNLSDQYLKARHQLNQGYLDALLRLDRQGLTAEERLSRDTLQYELELALVDETYPQRFLPMNQFYNRVITFVQLGSGESAQPFNRVEDYDNFIQRMGEFSLWIDSAIVRMEEGSRSDVVLPRVLVQRMIPQLQAQLDLVDQDSPFFAPLQQLPDALSQEERQALEQRYRQALAQTVFPALTQLKDYLADVYLAKSRGSDGWGGLPNGQAWYQHLANKHTTTRLSVDEIHHLGLEEVARILTEMDRVRQQVGFAGDLSDFFAHLGSAPQFFFTEKSALISAYSDLRNQINRVLPAYFDVMPIADYEVRAVEAFRERSAAGASYQAPAPDGSRPGFFYVNTFNLKAQPKWGMTTLSLHEAAPGHHFQIAIKQELEGVPSFQRFGGYTAFEEGWALYAEHLGIEMGLFHDPYQYFGKLSDEMLRAMRLVVDTGLHAKGWSRQQAIQYMLDNSPLAESDVTAEVERYMAIPGQALSYKIGQLTIMRLRQEAETALGDRFELKAFHNQVLMSGSLPMAVLEDKIRLWVAQY